jgi:nucleoside-diphosphate-sugar epimerase
MGRILNYCSSKKVKKLIYTGSVSAYGARKENINKFLKEDSPLIENEYPYGCQKKKIEGILREKKISTQIFVLRLASVNGPAGEKRKGIGLLNFVKHVSPILPVVNDTWTRQYLHEEDVLKIIELLIFKEIKDQFEVFNIAPPDFLTMPEMANLIHKKIVRIPDTIIKYIFFLGWHLSFGRVPTPQGSERFFIYPINVDGSKIKRLGFNYKYSSKEAFLGKYVN